MKILKICLLFIFASVAGQAQDLKMEEVPANIVASFEKELLDANAIEWKKDKENYKVEFAVDHVDYDIWYSLKGKEIKREVDILVSKIPTAISEILKENYASYEISDVKMIKRANKKTLYKIEVENANLEKVITLDENGRVLGIRTNR